MNNYFTHTPDDGNIAQLLIDHAADVNATDIGGITPLHVAAQNSNCNDSLIDTLDFDSFTYTSGSWNILPILINHHANVNAKTNSQWTPLHLAAEKGNDEIVEMFILWGAEINAEENKSVWASLHVAVQNG